MTRPGQLCHQGDVEVTAVAAAHQSDGLTPLQLLQYAVQTDKHDHGTAAQLLSLVVRDTA